MFWSRLEPDKRCPPAQTRHLQAWQPQARLTIVPCTYIAAHGHDSIVELTVILLSTMVSCLWMPPAQSISRPLSAKSAPAMVPCAQCVAPTATCMYEPAA